jgi:hypothetical protein
MTDVSSLASGWATWAEVFDGPEADEEDEGTERFDRLGAASSRFGEADPEAELDAPLVPLTIDPTGAPSSRRGRGERGPPAVVIGVGWRPALGIVVGCGKSMNGRG